MDLRTPFLVLLAADMLPLPSAPPTRTSAVKRDARRPGTNSTDSRSTPADRKRPTETPARRPE